MTRITQPHLNVDDPAEWKRQTFGMPIMHTIPVTLIGLGNILRFYFAPFLPPLDFLELP